MNTITVPRLFVYQYNYYLDKRKILRLVGIINVYDF